jgi:hypothetical protein
LPSYEAVPSQAGSYNNESIYLDRCPGVGRQADVKTPVETCCC